MSSYGDDIIKLLLEAVSPRVICTVLQLCGATERSVVVMPMVEKGEGDYKMGLCYGGEGRGRDKRGKMELPQYTINIA